MPAPIVTGRRPKTLLEALVPLYLFVLACCLPCSSDAWLIPARKTIASDRAVGAASTAAARSLRPREQRRARILAAKDSWKVTWLRSSSSSSDTTPTLTDYSRTRTSSPTKGGMLLMSLRHRLATTIQIVSSEDGTSNEGGTIRLVLASQSPRRREILSMMGLEGRFDVVPSPADERAVQRQLQQDGPVAPPKYAESLARAKALALAELLKAKPGSNRIVEMTSAPAPTAVVVLGSDTIVELDGHILEKPRDESEAKEMLSRLSGRQHLVHTGVAFACVKIGALSRDEVATRSFVDTAAVQFAALMPEDIDSYVSTGEPMDKAGSYGIQGMGGQMVESITGDFFTVMGLPMCRVSKELARLVDELQP